MWETAARTSRWGWKSSAPAASLTATCQGPPQTPTGPSSSVSTRRLPSTDRARSAAHGWGHSADTPTCWDPEVSHTERHGPHQHWGRGSLAPGWQEAGPFPRIRHLMRPSGEGEGPGPQARVSPTPEDAGPQGPDSPSHPGNLHTCHLHLSKWHLLSPSTHFPAKTAARPASL